ncbi:MAG: YbaB/EbfC family nucleoid-associated protein [Rhodothermales bacterium]|nr:YbaB/EbfC family nucleoid-associated protein [Rhodothermales bacterium]MBO6779188.1 YbaB/EbfC family nucleoid-associated protein [Rhodothermales bacterium]
MTEGGNMADMFGRMMDMQRKMTEAQDALAQRTVIAEAGGGMVQVTANGAQRVTAIKIEPQVIDPQDPEMLEDLIIAGINKALDEAAAMAKQEMSKAAGSFLPPGMDLNNLGL